MGPDSSVGNSGGYEITAFSIFGVLLKRVVSVLTYFEPPLANDDVRIRWKSKSGRWNFDDLKSANWTPEKVDELLAAMRGHGVVSDAEVTQTARNTISAGLTGIVTSLQSCYKSILRYSKIGRGRNDGLITTTRTSSNNPPELSLRSQMYLLICIRRRRHASELDHVDLQGIMCDRSFFKALQNKYPRLHRNFLSFRRVSAIHFVKFKLHPEMLVDDINRKQKPPVSEWDNYSFQPRSGIVLGPNYLTELFYELPLDNKPTSYCLDKF